MVGPSFAQGDRPGGRQYPYRRSCAVPACLTSRTWSMHNGGLNPCPIPAAPVAPLVLSAVATRRYPGHLVVVCIDRLTGSAFPCGSGRTNPWGDEHDNNAKQSIPDDDSPNNLLVELCRPGNSEINVFGDVQFISNHLPPGPHEGYHRAARRARWRAEACCWDCIIEICPWVEILRISGSKSNTGRSEPPIPRDLGCSTVASCSGLS